MTDRRLLPTILVLSLIACTHVWGATGKGLLSAQTTFDPDGYSARIAITNSSKWDVDAFGLTLDVTYADGTKSRTERLVDLQPLLDSQLSAGQQPTPFKPDEVRYEVFSVERHDGTSVERIETTVDMITAGSKAKASNKAALQELKRARTASAEADEIAAQIILKNLNDLESSEVIPQTIKELEGVLNRQAAANSRQYLESSILGTISNLQSLRTRRADQQPELLKQLASRGQARARAFREYAQVMEEGGTQ
jgi:hypothetical protein